jgi:hypothetical protein
MRRKSAGTAAIAEGALDPLLQPIRRAFAEDEEVSVGRVLSAKGTWSRANSSRRNDE